MSEVISTIQLEKEKFNGFKIPGKLGAFLGQLSRSGSMFIWGTKGSGKSTFALVIAKALAALLGIGIYFSSEEGPGFTFKNRLIRTGTSHKNLMVAGSHTLDEIKSLIKKHKATFIILDSVQMSRFNTNQTNEIYDWCKENNVFLILINHAKKDGEYKGNSMLAHMVDTEIRLDNGTAYIEKSRSVEGGSFPVPMIKNQTASIIEELDKRKNPELILSYLGKAEKLTTTKHTYNLSDYMFCTPDGKTLYLVPPHRVSEVQGKSAPKAEAMHEEFNHYPANGKGFEIDLPEIKEVKSGTAKRIWYQSDKTIAPGDRKGKMNGYYHDFDSGKRTVYELDDVIIIKNLKINYRGILN